LYKFINEELRFLPQNELTINTYISASYFENGDDEFVSIHEKLIIFDENTVKEINSDVNNEKKGNILKNIIRPFCKRF